MGATNDLPRPIAATGLTLIDFVWFDSWRPCAGKIIYNSTFSIPGVSIAIAVFAAKGHYKPVGSCVAAGVPRRWRHDALAVLRRPKVGHPMHGAHAIKQPCSLKMGDGLLCGGRTLESNRTGSAVSIAARNITMVSNRVAKMTGV
jgi:hypothetical protein